MLTTIAVLTADAGIGVGNTTCSGVIPTAVPVGIVKSKPMVPPTSPVTVMEIVLPAVAPVPVMFKPVMNVVCPATPASVAVPAVAAKSPESALVGVSVLSDGLSDGSGCSMAEMKLCKLSPAEFSSKSCPAVPAGMTKPCPTTATWPKLTYRMPVLGADTRIARRALLLEAICTAAEPIAKFLCSVDVLLIT